MDEIGLTMQINLEINLVTSVEFLNDEHFASLNRGATQAHDAGDMPRAVTLLQQAKAHQGDAYSDTRLALYLQKAGRFDEAMKEFDWLLSRVHRQVEERLPDASSVRRKSIEAFMLQKIHDKARLACKRQRETALEKWHEELSEKCQLEALRLQELADHIDQKKTASSHQ